MSTAPTSISLRHPSEHATVLKTLNHLGFSCVEEEGEEMSPAPKCGGLIAGSKRARDGRTCKD